MADAPDSKSGGSNTVWVRVPPPAPIVKPVHSTGFIHLSDIDYNFHFHLGRVYE